ncbi:hypothetical protein CEUSTIGMA_g8950.t1 [Chlamydomonas eustigma]|uniref:ERCC1-like central domain-containing protein n=1 Tax=Chlamydomonas eustigma TaxID=1157962 RepID=A0A250XF37_9CHLO|nr:hypothetical protein CEUSTIGMA_g8950.t1 [Chlamydomonas eustigma]|eukprot:GAX81522.1 hypothetical protein CEUSTIGMA_g8950.t1 [Chlamydomonas eustigma]
MRLNSGAGSGSGSGPALNSTSQLAPSSKFPSAEMSSGSSLLNPAGILKAAENPYLLQLSSSNPAGMHHSNEGPAMRNNNSISSVASTVQYAAAWHGAGLSSRPTSGPVSTGSAGNGSAGLIVTKSASHAPHFVGVNTIIVSKRQAGNPLLKHIRNVRWQHGDVTADYVVGQNACVLFVSLRYHLLHPEYILHRIKEQLRAWGLIVVLCHIDVEDVIKPLAEVTRAAVLNSCTLVCAWSPEECARYIETFKSYETKPASSIQERVEHDYASRLASALTSSVRGVNKTDAATLGAARGTLAGLFRSTREDLSACPGIGPTKVQRLLDTFNQPFRKEISSKVSLVEDRESRPRVEQVITRTCPSEEALTTREDREVDEVDELLVKATQILATAVGRSGTDSDDVGFEDT